MTKKKIFIYSIIIFVLVVVLIGKNYSSFDFKPITIKQNNNVKLQYDYGLINNNKVLSLLNNLSDSNPEQIQKYNMGLSEVIVKSTNDINKTNVVIANGEKNTIIINITEQPIIKINNLLSNIRKYGLVIKNMRIYKVNNQYNISLQVGI